MNVGELIKCLYYTDIADPVHLLRVRQIVIRFCFTNSETRLDDKVQFINSINSFDNIFLCSLMKSCKASGTAFELQRPRRPSENS